jgi:hypothetical protein
LVLVKEQLVKVLLGLEPQEQAQVMVLLDLVQQGLVPLVQVQVKEQLAKEQQVMVQLAQVLELVKVLQVQEQV